MTDSMRDRLARHEAITVLECPLEGHVVIKTDELYEIMDLAHEASHYVSDDEFSEDESSLRLSVLQLATQVEMTRISASAHTGEKHLSDPVALAEAYLNFVQGGVQ